MLNLIPGGLIGKGIAALIAISVILGAYAGWRSHLIHVGQQQALDAVKEQNAIAKRAADKVEKTVDECFNTEGYVWSVITGKCEPETVE